MESEKQTREELKERIMEQLDELSLEELEKVAGGGLFDILTGRGQRGLEGDKTMSENNNREEMDTELNPNDLDQVAGGGILQDLINRIVNSGKSPEYKEILKTEGKAAAAAACCADNPDLCGFCAAAVTMLK